MRNRAPLRRATFLRLMLATADAGSALAWLPASPPFAAAPALTVKDGRFFLRGEPLQIVCGELHYARIPRAYWQQRLAMARAMGLNAIATYVFWNVHEAEPGRYDFTGERDLAAFIRLAQSLDLHVVLRPGPYVCGEWDLGGYPAWLLADPAAIVRSRDERFMGPARRWLSRLGAEVAPLMASRGGPVIAVQVENEYGSFGTDRAYLAAIFAAFRDAGLTRECTFTADGAPELSAGSLPGVLPFLNSGSPRDEMKDLAAFRPGTAMMCSEYYPGFFDHWGEPHHLTAAADAVADVGWLLERGDSVNLYLFHGGTNFGFWSGANATPELAYQPTTTSYDYDAPLDEGGAPTEKYHRLRELIVRHTGPAPTPAAVPARIAIEPFALDRCAPYAPLLGAPVRVERPRSMESFGQSFGSMLYRTTVSGPLQGPLAFGDVRDYAVISLDGRAAGVLDRRARERELALDVPAGPHALEVFVESTGRINYGRTFGADRKGLVGPITFAGRELTGWDVFCLPMDDLAGLHFDVAPVSGPAFHRGSFSLRELGDTYLDVRMLGKGSLWVNGHNAGRFWDIGPQYALYVPAAWLRVGSNEVIAFDLMERSVRRLQGMRGPLFAPLAE
jgi:beta-galactosidase